MGMYGYIHKGAVGLVALRAFVALMAERPLLQETAVVMDNLSISTHPVKTDNPDADTAYEQFLAFRNHRLKELRLATGGDGFYTIHVNIRFEADDGPTPVAFDIVASFYPRTFENKVYIDISSPAFQQFMEDNESPLTQLIDAIEDAALSREMGSRENSLEWSRQQTQKPEKKGVTPPPDRSGFVYLMEAGGRFKIGRSKNVETRLRHLNSPNLKTSIPFEITLLHSIAVSNQITAEKYLHERFAGKRRRSEWFDLSPEDVEWFRGLREGDLEQEQEHPHA